MGEIDQHHTQSGNFPLLTIVIQQNKMNKLKEKFLKELKQRFAYIFDAESCQIKNDEYPDDPWVIVAEYDGLRFRFINDRSDFNLDLGLITEPNRWYCLWDILEFVTKDLLLMERPTPKNKISAVHKLLKEYYEKIKVVLKNSRHQLRSFR
jgi:hypothetical protein